MTRAPALALEMSQRVASIALRDADSSLTVRALGAGRDAAEGVLAVADALLRERGVRPDELKLVAASIGPGGFTGVRIAIAAAQAIAFASGATGIGVPSAIVAAESTLRGAAAQSALSLLSIKRGANGADAWATRLDRAADGTWIAGTGRLATLAEILAELASSPVEVILADSSQRVGDRPIAESLPAIRLVEPVFDAGCCLSVAERSKQRLDERPGQRRDDQSGASFALRALYPRRPEAVEIWDARLASSENERGV